MPMQVRPVRERPAAATAAGDGAASGMPVPPKAKRRWLAPRREEQPHRPAAGRKQHHAWTADLQADLRAASPPPPPPPPGPVPRVQAWDDALRRLVADGGHFDDLQRWAAAGPRRGVDGAYAALRALRLADGVTARVFRGRWDVAARRPREERRAVPVRNLLQPKSYAAVAAPKPPKRRREEARGTATPSRRSPARGAPPTDGRRLTALAVVADVAEQRAGWATSSGALPFPAAAVEALRGPFALPPEMTAEVRTPAEGTAAATATAGPAAGSLARAVQDAVEALLQAQELQERLVAENAALAEGLRRVDERLQRALARSAELQDAASAADVRAAALAAENAGLAKGRAALEDRNAELERVYTILRKIMCSTCG